MTEDRGQRTDKKNGRNFLSVFCFLSSVVWPLAACGFHPIYGAHDGPNGPVADQLSQVAIDNIPDRRGQELRNDLIDRMYRKGRPSQPTYHLRVNIRITEEQTGILANATATLTELNTFGDYVLTNAKDKEILRGSAHSVTSYSLLGNQYATLTAHDSAVDRTVNEISEQIVNRLSLYFADPPAKAEDNTP